MYQSLQDKQKRLADQLAKFDRLAVALSGGVDSAFLLAEAADVLGGNLIAVTARSPIHPQSEVEDATRITKQLGVSHIIVDSDEMTLDAFLANPPERCYICKKHVFGGLFDIIREKGFRYLAHGANTDDLGDYRPGLQAARELGVVAPLVDAGFSKQEIREAARLRGLHVWDKPAMACIATRFPYGTRIVAEHVEQVRQAEAILVQAGFSGCRVRHHGDVARIEVPLDQLTGLVGDPHRQRIADALGRLGFMHVCADLEGYVTGSMNRTLDSPGENRTDDVPSAAPPSESATNENDDRSSG
jgi:pyridinium-3,5-biscarboxylic acid mononucleotide sulfurtransferase